MKDVLGVRPGYDYSVVDRPAPALVVAVTPGTAPVNAADLTKELGVAVHVADASVEEQLAAPPAGPVAFAPGGKPGSRFESLLSGEPPLEFAPPKTGTYQPLEPSRLLLVNEPMKVTICVSPEAGWGELETFLGGTQERLTVAMYQFTAPHIFAAVQKAVTPAGRNLTLVLHPVPEKPPHNRSESPRPPQKRTRSQAVQTEEKGKDFQFVVGDADQKAHPDGLWASPTTSRWPCATARLSGYRAATGNRRTSPTSTLSAASPASCCQGFQKKYNRDYHAIIENEKTRLRL